MKFTVQAVILNERGEVLAVSRKDDHTDFGLPGGKVDPEDYTDEVYAPLEMALMRELKEETGLTFNPSNMSLVLAIHKDGYMSYTYLIHKWGGEIETDEPHVVKWVPFIIIKQGSFGRYNSLVAESLTDMGVEFKNLSDPEGEYYFHTSQFEYDDYGTVSIVSKAHWDEEECLSDSMSDNEYEDIHRMCGNGGIGLGEVCESVFDLSAKIDGEWVWIKDVEEIKKYMLAAGFKENEEFSKFLSD